MALTAAQKQRLADIRDRAAEPILGAFRKAGYSGTHTSRQLRAKDVEDNKRAMSVAWKTAHPPSADKGQGQTSGAGALQLKGRHSRAQSDWRRHLHSSKYAAVPQKGRLAAAARAEQSRRRRSVRDKPGYQGP